MYAINLTTEANQNLNSLEIPMLQNYGGYGLNWVSSFKTLFIVFEFRLGVLVFISSYDDYFSFFI